MFRSQTFLTSSLLVFFLSCAVSINAQALKNISTNAIQLSIGNSMFIANDEVKSNNVGGISFDLSYQKSFLKHWFVKAEYSHFKTEGIAKNLQSASQVKGSVLSAYVGINLQRQSYFYSLALGTGFLSSKTNLNLLDSNNNFYSGMEPFDDSFETQAAIKKGIVRIKWSHLI